MASCVDCMCNPFLCPPCPLPVPTPLLTFPARAVYRATSTANADGSFAVAVTPYLGGTPIYINNGGAGSTVWNGSAYVNVTPISNAAGNARVVGLGVRIRLAVPLTSAPGFIYAGSVPALTPTGVGSLTPNALAGVAMLKLISSRDGAYAVARPEDIMAFHFNSTPNVTGTTTIVGDWTTPVIACTGLPASCSILVEAVLALECTPNVSASSSIDQAPVPTHNNRPTSTPDTLLSVSRQALSDASGEIAQLPTRASESVSSVIAAIGNGIANVLAPTYPNDDFTLRRPRLLH